MTIRNITVNNAMKKTSTTKGQKKINSKTASPYPDTDKLRVAGVVILAILFLYLPYDHGGFYPRSRAFLAILAFLFLSMKLIFPTGEKYPRSLKICAGFFFAFLLISTVFSTDIHNSVLQVLYFFFCFIFFIMGYYIIKSKEIFRPLAYFLMGNLFLVCLFGMISFVVRNDPDARAFGRFFQADILGGFLVIFIPIAVMLFLISKRWLAAGFNLFISAFSLAVLFLTFSRGAFISFIVVFPFIIWHARKYSNFLQIFTRLAMLLVLGTAIIFIASGRKGGENIAANQIKKRIEETRSIKVADHSRSSRFDFYSAALKIAVDRPLTGTGLGTFGYHYPRYQKKVAYYSRYVHSFYFSLVSEGGIPALLAFLALLVALALTIRKSIDSIDDSDGFTRPAAFALALGLISSLLHIAIDVDFHFAGIAFIFWAIAGILAGLGQADSIVPSRKTPERAARLLCAILVALMMFPPFLYYLSFRFQKMGQNAVKANNLILAKNYFRKAVQFDPFNNETHRKLANFLHNTGRSKEALEFANRAVSLSPFRARNYEMRGRVLAGLDRLRPASEDFKKALSLDPVNQIYAYYGLGQYYSGIGQSDKAIDLYEKVIDYYGNVEMNRLWHFRAIPIRPQVAMIYIATADIYVDRKDYDKAITYYMESLRFEEGISSLFGLGYSYFQKGDWEKSLTIFLRLVTIKEDYDLPYFYISECYRELGRPEKARRNLETYYKLHQEVEEKIKKENN